MDDDDDTKHCPYCSWCDKCTCDEEDDSPSEQTLVEDLINDALGG